MIDLTYFFASFVSAMLLAITVAMADGQLLPATAYATGLVSLGILVWIATNARQTTEEVRDMGLKVSWFQGVSELLPVVATGWIAGLFLETATAAYLVNDALVFAANSVMTIAVLLSGSTCSALTLRHQDIININILGRAKRPSTVNRALLFKGGQAFIVSAAILVPPMNTWYEKLILVALSFTVWTLLTQKMSSEANRISIVTTAGTYLPVLATGMAIDYYVFKLSEASSTWVTSVGAIAGCLGIVMLAMPTAVLLLQVESNWRYVKRQVNELIYGKNA